jgi:hypothetical protein
MADKKYFEEVVYTRMFLVQLILSEKFPEECKLIIAANNSQTN